MASRPSEGNWRQFESGCDGRIRSAQPPGLLVRGGEGGSASRRCGFARLGAIPDAMRIGSSCRGGRSGPRFRGRSNMREARGPLRGPKICSADECAAWIPAMSSAGEPAPAGGAKSLPRSGARSGVIGREWPGEGIGMPRGLGLCAARGRGCSPGQFRVFSVRGRGLKDAIARPGIEAE
jgi:hypothetical protein